jgi:anti-sigma-K factor RskA
VTRAVTLPSDHSAFRDQAAAYALGALTAEERADFEAHVSVCAECSAEVRSYAPVVAALAEGVPQQDPPAQLRGRVMAAVQRSGVPASSTVAASGGPTTASRSYRRPVAPWLLAAASLLAAVALGGYSGRVRGQLAALEQRVRDVTQRADASERQLAELQEKVAQDRAVVVVLNASDLVRVDLAGQPVAPRAAARAFWSRSRGLVFTASSLPPLPKDRTYQLWVVTAQAAVGAGLLKPEGDGAAHAVFMTPSDLAKPVAIALTIEPDGGVPAPTGDKYLVGLVN